MTSQQVDTFSARLAAEMAALDASSRSDLLVRVGRMELKMRAIGQERPVWRGPVPETKILGAEVVVPTEQGERRGRVVCFGIVQPGAEFERSVFVHVPASGTNHEVPGSSVRLASPEDIERMRAEGAMADRLREAAYAAERGPKRPDEALRNQRKRGLRDPGLILEMLELARKSDAVSAIDEGGANHKISGTGGRRLYLFKTQLRVDLSGFSVKHPAVREISETEAKEMHLGKVRGQLLFDDRQAALSAFSACLAALKG